ncbi:MAG: hypothetical protein A2285_09580 [Elusimicrobia bacterium RIFOXYA12_FULL_57_11]|nr:MAG: hypothetical protein A2285_09580 [Elusimicrobia bacterium RIFOXYA12_FULL_57_11]
MQGKYKFMVTVAGLFLLPFLILSWHFISGSDALRKKDMLRYFEMRTIAGARIVANELNANYNLSRMTGDRKFLDSGAAFRKTTMALRVKETPFIYSELALVSASGREVCRVSAGKDGKAVADYAKTPVFTEAKKAAASVGAVEYGDYTPPALILVQPVTNSGVKPEFYLAGRLSLAYLGEIVRLMGKNSMGNFGLLDGGGQIIADSMNKSTIKPGIPAPPELVSLIAAAQEREVQNLAREVFLRKGSSLISVSNVPGSSWWVYEIMNSADMAVYRFTSQAGQVVFSGAMIIVVFGVLTYVLAMRWLVRGHAGGDAKPEGK